MKTLVLTVLMIVTVQISYAGEASDSHDQESKPIRIIREIR